MKLKFDSSTILDRDSVSRAIKNAGDITIQRVPGVIRRVTDLADDDMPFGADEEKDENGKATLGYFRDAHGGCRPPDTPGEARSLLRGTSGEALTVKWITSLQQKGLELQDLHIHMLELMERSESVV